MSARLRLPRPVLWISSEKIHDAIGAPGINEENLRAVFSRQRNDRPLNRAGHAAPRANGTFDGEYETAICGLSSDPARRGETAEALSGLRRPRAETIHHDLRLYEGASGSRVRRYPRWGDEQKRKWAGLLTQDPTGGLDGLAPGDCGEFLSVSPSRRTGCPAQAKPVIASIESWHGATVSATSGGCRTLFNRHRVVANVAA